MSKKIKDIGIRIDFLEKYLGLSSTAFGQVIDFSPQYIYKVKTGLIKNPSHKFFENLRLNFPEWYSYIVGTVKNPPQLSKSSPGSTIEGQGGQTYAQVPECMLPPADPGGEPRPGSYGTNVDLSSHKVVHIVEPSHGDIIKQFKDKEWALDINKKLLEIEKYAPEKKEFIKGMLSGIIESYVPRPKKKLKDLT